MSNSFGASSPSEEVAEHYRDEIKGKTVLVTGVSPGGLGAQFAKAIAPFQPELLILAGRNTAKLEETAKTLKEAVPDVNTRALKLDLASQKQIKDAAAEVNGYDETVDVIVNNAGIMAVPYGTTEDGLENQFGCNYIGHFLLTNLLLPKMIKSGKKIRVVNITSDGHLINGIRFHDPGFLRGTFYNKWLAYGQSKTANILFSRYLAKTAGDKGVFLSVHPGQIDTNLGSFLTQEDIKGFGWDRPDRGDFIQYNPKELTAGASTHVVAAFDPTLHEHNGSYLRDCQVHNEDVAEWAASDENATRLWKLGEDIVGQHFEL